MLRMRQGCRLRDAPGPDIHAMALAFMLSQRIEDLAAPVSERHARMPQQSASRARQGAGTVGIGHLQGNVR